MARQIKRLSDRAVHAKKEKGLYPDGNGLHLQVSSSGAKSWILRFKRNGKARDMGLGSLRNITLAQARERAQVARQRLAEGLDPIEARASQAAEKRLAQSRAKTFRQAAAEFLAAHEAGWRNAKHAGQWRTTLEQYVHPVMGGIPVAEIGTQDVLNVLRPLWLGDELNGPRPETASRVRGRIEAIIDAARVDDDAQRANPARWKGHLQHKLPKRSKVQATRHHPALRFPEIPAFMLELRSQEGITPRALEFVILCASRAGEGLGAKFTEFDLEAGEWTVPASRMKNDKPHKVPLSARVSAIVREMAGARTSDFVFPSSQKRDAPLTTAGLWAFLRGIRPNVTTHGFRSTFRDWAAETTNFPNHVVEMALAHAIPGAVEAAYRRGDLFAKRRELMGAWSAYCESQAVPSQQRAKRIARPSREPDIARKLHARAD